MKVLVIGSSSIDNYIVIDGFLKEGFKYNIKEKIECPGGSALTMALLLSKWEVETYLTTVLGSDTDSDFLYEYLEKENVVTKYVLRKNIDTIKKYILINSDNVDTILNYKKEKFNDKIEYDIDPDFILIDSEYLDFANDAISKNPNSKVILNLNDYNNNTDKLCKQSDYVICSKDTAELISKQRIDYNRPDTLKKVINYMTDEFDAKVIITLGEKGCIYKLDDKIKIMGAIKVGLKDASNARDIFTGAFTYGLTKELDLEKCLKIATIASGLGVKMIGSTSSIPLITEVYKLYEKNR